MDAMEASARQSRELKAEAHVQAWLSGVDFHDEGLSSQHQSLRDSTLENRRPERCHAPPTRIQDPARARCREDKPYDPKPPEARRALNPDRGS